MIRRLSSASTVGQGLENEESWEPVYNERGDIVRLVVHRQVTRVG